MTPITPEMVDRFAVAMRHGYYWCIPCQKIIEPLNQGEANLQRCPECDCARIAFYPAVLPGSKDDENKK